MKALPAHDAHDGVAAKLLPPALGLTVVHHEVRVSELARRAEIKNAVLDRTFENDRGIAERAIGDSHGRTSNDVVRNFVPDQNTQGICTCIAADGERDDRFGVADAGCPASCGAIIELLEERHVDRRDSVLGRATRFDFLQWNGMPREISTRPFRSPASRIGYG